jgi:hypothetical protein
MILTPDSALCLLAAFVGGVAFGAIFLGRERP